MTLVVCHLQAINLLVSFANANLKQEDMAAGDLVAPVPTNDAGFGIGTCDCDPIRECYYEVVVHLPPRT
jgi:hypothetical protein